MTIATADLSRLAAPEAVALRVRRRRAGLRACWVEHMLDLGRHQLTRWERGESVCPDDVHAQLVTLYERWERHQLAGRDLVNGVKAMPRKRRARRSDAASSTG